MADREGLLPSAAEAAIGAIPGVGPLVAPFAGPLVQALTAERARRRSVAIKAAEHASGMSREDLEELLATDPRLVSLTITLLYAAGMNGHDETLQRLGTVLGFAAAQPQFAEEAADCLEALKGLRDGHLWVLAFAESRAEEAPPGANEATPAPNDGRWSSKEAAEATGIEPELVSGYIAGLVAAGLVTNARILTYPGGSPVDYTITGLGRRLVRMGHLHRQQAERPQG